MNSKEFIDPDEAIKFVQSLQENNTVEIATTVLGTFCITWLENKKYTALDGKEYTDEVWTKEDGTMIACQDLEHEHAKNIIRMILRQDRSNRIAEARAYGDLQSAIKSIVSGDDASDEGGHSEQRVLH